MKIQIEGMDQPIEVDDSFAQKSPEMQNAIVSDISNELKAKGIAKDVQKYSDKSALDIAGEAISNIPHSAKELAVNTVQPFLHPVETAENIGKIGKGVLQHLGIVSGKESEKYADAVGQMLMDRYGSSEAILHTIATDPVGMLADLSTVLSAGGTLEARLPGLAGKVAKVAGKVGTVTDPLNLAVKGARGAAVAADTLTGGHLGTAAAVARKDVSRAINRDQTTPQSLSLAATAQQAQTGQAPILPDVGGENVRGLTERVAQTPGAGRSIVVPFLEQRQKAQMGRIGDDLKTLTGTKRSAIEATEATIQAREAEAKPAYDKAMNFNALQDPAIVKAWTEATRTGHGKSILNSDELKKNLQSDYGIEDIKNAPLMVLINEWKKVGDDREGDALRAGAKNTAGSISKTVDSVVNVVKARNPDYATALSMWSGRASYLDAIEQGRDILKKNVSGEEFTKNFKSLKPNVQDGVREGAVSAILAQMQNDAGKLSDFTKYLRSPAMRQKIAAIMPTPQAQAKWNTILSSEEKISELTGQALRGSQTARRLAEMSQAKELVGDLVIDAFTGAHGVGLMKRIIVGGAKKIRDTYRAQIDKEVARILTSPSALKDLQKALGGNIKPRSPILLKDIKPGLRASRVVGAVNSGLATSPQN